LPNPHVLPVATVWPLCGHCVATVWPLCGHCDSGTILCYEAHGIASAPLTPAPCNPAPSATRPEEEEGERERKRTRKRKRKRTLRFEKVLLPTRSSLIQAGSSGSTSFAHPRGGPVGRNSPCRPPCYASACAMNNSCFAQFMFRTCTS